MIQLFAWCAVIGAFTTAFALGTLYRYLRKKNLEKKYRKFWNYEIKNK